MTQYRVRDGRGGFRLVGDADPVHVVGPTEVREIPDPAQLREQEDPEGVAEYRYNGQEGHRGPMTLAQINAANRRLWEPDKQEDRRDNSGGIVGNDAFEQEETGGGSSFETRERLDERQYSSGNKSYVLSLPSSAGTFYEAEPGETGEDGGEIVDIYAVGGESGERTYVCSVSGPGNFVLENDEHGAHLFRIDEGETERLPLGDLPVRIGSQDNAHHVAALKKGPTRGRARTMARMPTPAARAW